MVNNSIQENILELLSGISDPEIPVVSIIEMGMVRGVEFQENRPVVVITPTYSGCPAMHQIQDDIAAVLKSNGIDAEVKTRLSPPWTTDWMTEETKQKLKKYGIAPPIGFSKDLKMDLFSVIQKVNCPFCDSGETELKSEFGSTACKSYYHCNSCHQSFEYFKCH